MPKKYKPKTPFQLIGGELKRVGKKIISPVSRAMDKFESKLKKVNDARVNRNLNLIDKNFGGMDNYTKMMKKNEEMLKRGMQGKKR